MGFFPSRFSEIFYFVFHIKGEKIFFDERFLNRADIYATYSVAKMNIKSKEIWRVLIHECGYQAYVQ